MLQDSGRRIVAVVTSYRPGPELAENVALLSDQVDRVVIVDDGSAELAERFVTPLASDRVRTVLLPVNGGIASALNAGCSAADLEPGDLVVTFDQDSAVPQGYVEALVATWDAAVADGVKVGLVAPETFAGISQTGGMAADGRLRALRPIQSGSLVSAEVLKLAGGFREDLFIDLVDLEYFLRLTAGRWRSIAVPGLNLPHQLGRFYATTVLGRTVKTSFSTPFRYYYRARNRVVVNRAYRGSAGRFLRIELIKDLAHLLLVLYFARGRLAIARVVAAGVRDGRRGRMGRIPSDVESRARTVSWRGRPVEFG